MSSLLDRLVSEGNDLMVVLENEQVVQEVKMGSAAVVRYCSRRVLQLINASLSGPVVLAQRACEILCGGNERITEACTRPESMMSLLVTYDVVNEAQWARLLETLLLRQRSALLSFIDARLTLSHLQELGARLRGMRPTRRFASLLIVEALQSTRLFTAKVRWTEDVFVAFALSSEQASHEVLLLALREAASRSQPAHAALATRIAQSSILTGLFDKSTVALRCLAKMLPALRGKVLPTALKRRLVELLPALPAMLLEDSEGEKAVAMATFASEIVLLRDPQLETALPKSGLPLAMTTLLLRHENAVLIHAPLSEAIIDLLERPNAASLGNPAFSSADTPLQEHILRDCGWSARADDYTAHLAEDTLPIRPSSREAHVARLCDAVNLQRQTAEELRLSPPQPPAPHHSATHQRVLGTPVPGHRVTQKKKILESVAV